MFLSNSRKYFVLAGFLALVFQACGSLQSNDNKPVPVVVETKSDFPFPVKEPEVYQANMVVMSAGVESRWFIARNREKSRFDTFAGSVPAFSQIVNGRRYNLDHQRKIYADMDVPGGTGGYDGIAANFFRAKEYREFEDLGIEGKLHKFKVKEPSAAKSSILIYIDEATGMMAKQEFFDSADAAGQQARVTCKLRDLKLEADDSVFTIPIGYKLVTADAFRKQRP
ncbi:MAG: hypothetical protein ABL999_03915 [Pyrinomonadaceae bacterium]